MSPRLLAQRGEGQQAVATAKRLALTAREAGEPQCVADGFAAAAQLLRAQGRLQQAKTLLVEVNQFAGIHADPYYASALPELVLFSMAPGGVEPPHADSKFLENACSE
jgi:hypothetical protein